jgi:hypothetical protein
MTSLVQFLNILRTTENVIESSDSASSGSIVLRIVVVGIILIFLFLIVVAVLIIMKPDLFKKTTREEEMGVDFIYDVDTSAKVGDTKSFLPYEKINDYTIDMGDYNYRAILEVSSINYGLMSATEQSMVDASFRRFLDSLDFPIEIYIQTREFDAQRVTDDLVERSQNAIKKYPQLEEYFNEYIYEMSGITEKFKNSKVKKKYIIVPFDNKDLLDVSELSPAEINDFALENLISRCNICAAGLGSIGLDVTLLTRPQIAEVLYSYYHRDYFRIAEDITDGSLTALVINGPDHRKDDRYVLDSILTAAQTSIKTRLMNAKATDEEIVFYRYIFNELEKFKQDDTPETIAQLMRSSFGAAVAHGYEDDYYAYARSHPEAHFWEETNKDYNGGRVSVPQGVAQSTGFQQVPENQRTLGGGVPVQGNANYGVFDPLGLGNQSPNNNNGGGVQ